MPSAYWPLRCPAGLGRHLKEDDGAGARQPDFSAEARSITRGPTNNAWETIAIAANLLQWLADHDTNLRTCAQGDIDNWLPSAPGTHRARPFIRWAAIAGTGHLAYAAEVSRRH